MSNSLDRFLSAQENTYDHALLEMHQGRKTSHWMWFVFPQIKGLGHSETAKKYALQNEEETRLYLQHEILGSRLLTITKIVVEEVHGKTTEQIFGFPDYLKFHSCLTLFNCVVENHPDLFHAEPYRIFHKALSKYEEGKTDPATIEILKNNTQY